MITRSKKGERLSVKREREEIAIMFIGTKKKDEGLIVPC